MAIQTPPNGGLFENSKTSAQVVRQIDAATHFPGVVRFGMLQVTQNSTANMSVNVGAGEAFVPGTQVSNVSGHTFNTQGIYFCLNDSTVNLTVTAADPTNPRIDLVVLQVIDTQYSGASDGAQLAVVTGTPAASPVAPSAPSNSITLARISVPANATSITSGDITDERAYSVKPYASLMRTNDFSIPAGVYTPVQFNAVQYDRSPAGYPSMVDLTNNPTRLTAPIAGVYEVGYSLTLSAGGSSTSTENINVWVYLNGGGVGQSWRNGSSFGYLPAGQTVLVEMNAGDYVEVDVNYTNANVIHGGSMFWAAMK